MNGFKLFCAATSLTAALLAGSTAANAQAAVMKECGAEYQTAKTAKTLIPGETWNQFLAECRTRKSAAAPAAAPASAPATAPATAAAPAAAPKAPAPAAAAPAATAPTADGKRTPTAGQQAFYSREKACGAEWKQKRAANQIVAGETWPKYLSECNARLKAAGQ